MFEKADILKNKGLKLKIDVEAMARGYQEMGELNLHISNNEMHHLEELAHHTTLNFIGVDEDV